MIPTDTRKPFDVREIIAASSTAASSTSSRRATARRWSPASRTSRACRWASSPTTASCSRARKGRALHRTVLPAQDPAGVPAEHHRLHGRAQVRERRHRQATAPRWSRRWPPPHVPKFTVIIGGSFGAGNYGMCGRAYSPRFLWMWPNARISRDGRRAGGQRAGHRQARRHRGQGRQLERRGRRRPSRQPSWTSSRTRHPYYASARLWDDGVIDPADTRAACWRWGLSASLNARSRTPKFGVFRMCMPARQPGGHCEPTSIRSTPEAKAMRARRQRAMVENGGRALLHRPRGGAAFKPVAWRLPAREVGDRAGRPGATAWCRATVAPHGARAAVGLMFGEAYGGGGADAMTNLVFAEAAQPPWRLHHHGAGAHRHGRPAPAPRGNAAQKARYMPRCDVAGELITAVGITEPGAGSDVAGIRTTAPPRRRRMGAQRRKMFITNGVHAACTVAAKSGPAAQRCRCSSSKRHARLHGRPRAQEDRLAVVRHRRAGV